MSRVYTEFISSAEGLAQIKEFAATFGHMPSGKYPILAVRTKEEFIGYVEMINIPVLHTAWAPGHGKDTVEGIKKLKAWAEVQHGECLTTCIDDSPMWKHMEKLGLENTGLVLFQSK